MDVSGFVQKSASSRNDDSLSTARAANVKAYLVALGVKSTITSKGYGLPKAKRSLASSRRADIYVIHQAPKPKPKPKPSQSAATPTPTPTPSQSVAVTGAISGTIQRYNSYDKCTDISLDYVKLYQGINLITTISGPTWTSTPNGRNFICDYKYTFQNLPNGTYTVEESFTQPDKCPWGLTQDVQPTWTYLGTKDDDLNQVHRIENLVVAGGADLSGIDLRLRNTD